MAKALSTAGVVAVLGTAAVFLMASQGQDAEASMPTASIASDAEVVRIQEHLLGAERVILARDLSQLTPQQRAARARNVALLRVYRERAEFPRNGDFPGRREPYFVDDRGVLCAMAYLIAESGRHDIVDRVRATRNNARIHELADDAALLAWLDEAGLTVDEAARIQPMYNGPGWIQNPEPRAVSVEYALASASASLLNGAAIAWNIAGRSATQPSGWRAAAAIIGGAAGVGLGTAGWHQEADARALNRWNTALGAVAVGVGSHMLIRRNRGRTAAARSEDQPQAGTPSRDRRARDFSFSIAPATTAGAAVNIGVTF